MKKRLLRIAKGMPICFLLLMQQPIQSQVSNPASWSQFVQSEQNISVRDTFRLQTFENSLADNWSYAPGEACSIINSSQANLEGKHGESSLKLPLNEQVSFSHFPLEPYGDIYIRLCIAGKKLMKGQNLKIKTYRPDKDEYATISTVSQDNSALPFKGISVNENPPGIDFISPTSTNTNHTGFYAIDSVYAHGTIPLYTLFTGNGEKWANTSSWTDLPAERHRNALIAGHITVNSKNHCNDVHLSDGLIDIQATGSLAIRDLTIHAPIQRSGSEVYGVTSSGEIDIQGKAYAAMTFEQKGKWYFVSFPFNVYASGIDPQFQLGDQSTVASGNYFYIKTYNGQRRATEQSTINNWEVTPRSAVNASQPIFEKNKGYLIALDEGANGSSIRFSSQEHIIPSDFGKNGSTSIKATINGQSATDNHNGWYLCGNPLPAPLLLSQIIPNKALGGYIYLYDGSSFQPYAIGSDLALPPFAAFFVKALEDTSLEIQVSSNAGKFQLLSSFLPLEGHEIEPGVASPVSNAPTPASLVHFLLTNKQLHFDNQSGRGKIRLLNMAGNIVFANELPIGISTYQLPVEAGTYILHIETMHYQAQHKCVITP